MRKKIARAMCEDVREFRAIPCLDLRVQVMLLILAGTSKKGVHGCLPVDASAGARVSNPVVAKQKVAFAHRDQVCSFCGSLVLKYSYLCIISLG